MKRDIMKYILDIEFILDNRGLLTCWSPECMGDDEACLLRDKIRKIKEEFT